MEEFLKIESEALALMHAGDYAPEPCEAHAALIGQFYAALQALDCDTRDFAMAAMRMGFHVGFDAAMAEIKNENQ